MISLYESNSALLRGATKVDNPLQLQRQKSAIDAKKKNRNERLKAHKNLAIVGLMFCYCFCCCAVSMFVCLLYFFMACKTVPQRWVVNRSRYKPINATKNNDKSRREEKKMQKIKQSCEIEDSLVSQWIKAAKLERVYYSCWWFFFTNYLQLLALCCWTKDWILLTPREFAVKLKRLYESIIFVVLLSYFSWRACA